MRDMRDVYLPPLYIQMKEMIRDKISSGEYAAGTRIPSERELSEQYNISRMTARDAITQLVNEGLVYRKRGKGTFVSFPKIKRDLLKLSGFSQMLREKGIESTNHVLSVDFIESDKIISNIFGISIGSICYEIKRLRCGNGVPIALEYSYLPQSLFPGLTKYDFNKDSLYEVIEKEYGFKLKFAKQWLSLYQPNKSEAKILGVSDNSQVLFFESTTYSDNDIAVESTKSFTRGDLCSYYTELWR